MILPILEGYSLYYQVCTKRLKEKINVIFNRGIRVVKKLPKRSNTVLSAKELQLNNPQENRLCNFILHAYDCTKFVNLLDERQLATRANDPVRKQLIVYDCAKNIYRKSYIYKSIHIWNDLPNLYHTVTSKLELKLLIKNNIEELVNKYKEGIG